MAVLDVAGDRVKHREEPADLLNMFGSRAGALVGASSSQLVARRKVSQPPGVARGARLDRIPLRLEQFAVDLELGSFGAPERVKRIHSCSQSHGCTASATRHGTSAFPAQRQRQIRAFGTAHLMPSVMQRI